MSVFDINIEKKIPIQENKQQIIDYFKKDMTTNSKKSLTSSKDGFIFTKFREAKSLLHYNMSFNIKSSPNGTELSIVGELQHVWVIVILLALGILFTQGIGLVVVIAFVYYQKVIATTYFNNLIVKMENSLQKNG